MTTTASAFGLFAVHSPDGILRQDALLNAIPSGYPVSLYQGTPLKLAAGQFAVADNGAAQVIDAVFAGCEFTDMLGKRQLSPVWPGGTQATDVTAYFYGSDQTTFRVASDTALTQAAIGQQFIMNTGSGHGSRSTDTLAAASEGAAGSLKVVNIGLDASTNNWGDPSVVVHVRMVRPAGLAD